VKTFMLILAIALILIPGTILAESVPRHSIGLALFTGREMSDGLGWRSYDEWYEGNNTIFIPSFGWILGKRWHINLEGNMGSYEFKRKTTGRKIHAFTLGLAIMAAYDFLKFDRWGAYVDLGVGLAHWSDTPSDHLLDRGGIPGMIQYGAGLKIPIGGSHFLKLAYRFAHTSGIFSDDNGINNHGILFGLTKTF
jgi:opacity protein-like surface antigen